jgi:hypothetical protein
VEKGNAYRIWVEKSRRKDNTRSGDNIKIDLREIGWCGMDWIHLALDRDQWWAVMNAVMKLRVR